MSTDTKAALETEKTALEERRAQLVSKLVDAELKLRDVVRQLAEHP